jgi:hypothetical protein
MGFYSVRYEGLHILLWRILQESLAPLGELGLTAFCRKDLTKPLKEIRAKVDLNISQVTEAEIGQLALLEAQNLDPQYLQNPSCVQDIEEIIRSRMQQGAICYVGKVGSEMVHHNWIFFHKWESHLGYTANLSDYEAFFGIAFTVPEWRGKGIHGAVNSHMLSVMQQSGFHIVYTRVELHNIASTKGLQRVGWDFYSTLLYFIPKQSDNVYRWEIRGPLDPFVLDQVRNKKAGNEREITKSASQGLDSLIK